MLNMKIQISIIALMLCSLVSMAQDSTIWSFRSTHLSYRIADMQYFKDHAYVLRVNYDGFVYAKKNKSVIVQFDQRLHYIKEFKIALNYEGKRAEPRKMIAIKDKLYLLFTGYKDNEELLLLYEIDPQTLTFPNPPIVLGTVRSSRSQIWMAQSKNGRFFSVLTYWGEKDKSTAYLTCYDHNFQRQYEEKKDLELKYYYAGCKKLLVDNEGNTFSIMESPPNYTNPPVLWQRYTEGESIVHTLAEKQKGLKIRNFTATALEEIILLAGYYTEQDPNDGRVKGITFLAYDKQNKGDYKQVQIELPRDLSKYTRLSSITRYREDENEIPALTAIDIAEWEGHGYLVIGQKQYYRMMSSGRLGESYPISTDVITFVTLLDYSLSRVKWAVPVCKYHESMVYGDNSVFVGLKEDKVHVFFNSNDSNNAKHKDDPPLYGTGFIQMTINPEGKYSTKVLHNDPDGLKVYPRLIKVIDEQSLFVVAGKTYNEKFGIIKW